MTLAVIPNETQTSAGHLITSAIGLVFTVILQGAGAAALAVGAGICGVLPKR